MAASGGKKKSLPPRVELVIVTLAEILKQQARDTEGEKGAAVAKTGA